MLHSLGKISGKYHRNAKDHTIWGIIGAKIATTINVTVSHRQNFVIIPPSGLIEFIEFGKLIS